MAIARVEGYVKPDALQAVFVVQCCGMTEQGMNFIVTALLWHCMAEEAAEMLRCWVKTFGGCRWCCEFSVVSMH